MEQSHRTLHAPKTRSIMSGILAKFPRDERALFVEHVCDLLMRDRFGPWAFAEYSIYKRFVRHRPAAEGKCRANLRHPAIRLARCPFQNTQPPGQSRFPQRRSRPSRSVDLSSTITDWSASTLACPSRLSQCSGDEPIRNPPSKQGCLPLQSGDFSFAA